MLGLNSETKTQPTIPIKNGENWILYFFRNNSNHIYLLVNLAIQSVPHKIETQLLKLPSSLRW